MRHREVYGDTPEQTAAEVGKIAAARARYRVQDDFNRELVDEIANKTGHENLAATCFVEVDFNGDGSLDPKIYTDDEIIAGLYSSRSSFHQSGGKWSSVLEHHRMSRDEFWEKKYDGYGGGSHGIVDTEWLVDNFYVGVYHATNGWPLGNADFLQVYEYHDISPKSIVESYCEQYASSGRFQQYVQEEINAMS